MYKSITEDKEEGDERLSERIINDYLNMRRLKMIVDKQEDEKQLAPLQQLYDDSMDSAEGQEEGDERLSEQIINEYLNRHHLKMIEQGQDYKLQGSEEINTPRPCEEQANHGRVLEEQY